ncbi:interferon-induced protein 44-like [Sardina pilchardus]|uniref:interferon-induced protein 44-like n=1 Tax=Sardina pilchardus TaxID=27697 RepID=UPI002E12CCAD
MESTISSIVTKLNLEMERQLLQLLPKPVRLHLLYQASTHGFNLSTLKDRFDKVGQFIIIVYLKRGEARGAYLGRDLNQNKHQKLFLFNLTSQQATSIPNKSKAEADVDPCKYGKAFKLRKIDFGVCVDFSSDEVYNTGWAEESITNRDGSLTEVEMFRVHDVGDILLYPWREMVWKESTREELRQSVVSHKVLSDSLNSARVLLLGPTGAGKSSFINSMRSVMYRQVIHLPIIGAAPEGFTKKLKSYPVRVERGGTPTSLTLCDMPSVGDSDSEGLSYSDTLAVLNGHVSDGYKFGFESPISPTDPCYRAEPKMRDRIHCVAFCLSASEVTDCSATQQKTYRKLHAAISALNIPQVILLTHVDQVCHAVKEDVCHVYTSRIVQERMQKAAELLGMSLSCVFPLKNYSSEHAVNCNTDILLLTAVQHMQDAVDDALEDLGDTSAVGCSSSRPPPSPE